MKKQLQTLILTGVIGMFACSSGQAISLTPLDADFFGFNTGNVNESVVFFVTGETVTEVYKDNVGGSEEKAFADDYTTTFSNSASDPSDFLIEWDGPDIITGSPIYLAVKDGTPRPFYIFDITGWNGTDDIEGTGFYPTQGAISHIAIFTGEGTTTVPDGGASLMLLGAGLGALGLVRRFVKR
jgi:hypothetical protein